MRARFALRSLAVPVALSALFAAPVYAAPQEAEEEGQEATEAAETTSSAETTTSAEAPADAPDSIPTASADHQATLDAIAAKSDDIERRLREISERVLLLRETVVTGKVAPTQALIVHRNEMGSSFRLEQVLYTLDDREIFARTDAEGFLDAQREFELINGNLPAGEHELKVSMVFGGSGFGLFTYLKGYRFKVESRYRFLVAEGRLTRLSVVAYEKPDITLEPKDRLAVRYDLEVGSVPSATGR